MMLPEWIAVMAGVLFLIGNFFQFKH